MTMFTSIKRKAVTGFGGSALLVGVLGVFSGSVLALPPAPMLVAPVINFPDCVIYTTNQAGPFRKFKVMPGLVTDTYAANICSENDILPEKGLFVAPDPDVPSYLIFNTVALAAGGTIHLKKSNKVLETHTANPGDLIIDGNVLKPPPVATRFFDIVPGSFTGGPGVPFRAQAPSNDPNDDIICVDATIDIVPGVYRNLDVNNCTVRFVTSGNDPLDYVFNWIASRNSDHVFVKPDDEIASLIVALFVSYGHTDNVNSARELGVTFYVDGSDGAGGGANDNSLSSVTNLKKVFEHGGDGDMNACHVYTPNGTTGLKGALTTYSRYLAENFEFNGGNNVTVKHPQEICVDVEFACACVASVACDGNDLVYTGDGVTPFTNLNVGTLFNTLPGANVNSAAPDASAQGNGGQDNDGVIRPGDPGVDLGVTIKVPVSAFGLAAGEYTPGFACPEVGAVIPVPLGFTMFPASILKTDGTTCEILTVP